jgi:predicted house-cleaning noncanonical NTP pyrophosphatase (MazG superfamily)
MASIKDPTKQRLCMLRLKLVEALEEELPECSSDEEEERSDEYIEIRSNIYSKLAL